jgi:hypothetical protein
MRLVSCFTFEKMSALAPGRSWIRLLVTMPASRKGGGSYGVLVLLLASLYNQAAVPLAVRRLLRKNARYKYRLIEGFTYRKRYGRFLYRGEAGMGLFGINARLSERRAGFRRLEGNSLHFRLHYRGKRQRLGNWGDGIGGQSGRRAAVGGRAVFAGEGNGYGAWGKCFTLRFAVGRTTHSMKVARLQGGHTTTRFVAT